MILQNIQTIQVLVFYKIGYNNSITLIGVTIMTDKNNKDSVEEASKSTKKNDKKKLQEEFLKTVDSKLHKEEKDIWFVKNKDHLNS